MINHIKYVTTSSGNNNKRSGTKLHYLSRPCEIRLAGFICRAHLYESQLLSVLREFEAMSPLKHRCRDHGKSWRHPCDMLRGEQGCCCEKTYFYEWECKSWRHSHDLLQTNRLYFFPLFIFVKKKKQNKTKQCGERSAQPCFGSHVFPIRLFESQSINCIWKCYIFPFSYLNHTCTSFQLPRWHCGAT